MNNIPIAIISALNQRTRSNAFLLPWSINPSLMFTPLSPFNTSGQYHHPCLDLNLLTTSLPQPPKILSTKHTSNDTITVPNRWPLKVPKPMIITMKALRHWNTPNLNRIRRGKTRTPRWHHHHRRRKRSIEFGQIRETGIRFPLFRKLLLLLLVDNEPKSTGHPVDWNITPMSRIRRRRPQKLQVRARACQSEWYNQLKSSLEMRKRPSK